jgi:hypothetical protein
VLTCKSVHGLFLSGKYQPEHCVQKSPKKEGERAEFCVL